MSHFKFYTLSEPGKYWIKIWVLADAKMHIFAMLNCTLASKETRLKKTKERAVLDLAKKYLNKGLKLLLTLYFAMQI